MCLTLTHYPLLSFYVGWGCGEVAGRRGEGWEGFIVFESFLLLCSVASEGFGSGGVTTRPWAARHKTWRWWMIPKPQPFCLWGTAFFREQEVGGCELVVSF